MKNLDFLDVTFAVAFLGGMALIGLGNLSGDQLSTIKEMTALAGGLLGGKKLPTLLGSK